MSSNDKGTALITGASTGLGAVYADRIAKRGYNLILVARDAGRMDTLAERLRTEAGVTVEVIGADLTDGDDLAKVEAKLAEDTAVTLLVNNAGMSLDGDLLSTEPSKINAMITLNITAPTALARVAGKAFVARGAGAIINIASVLALAPENFDGIYSGTKAYILNLSLSLDNQYRSKGLYVQAVLPGATRTEIWERSGKDIDAFPAEMVMTAGDLVDAALVGFDRREGVTIPPLADEGQWNATNDARIAMAPFISRRDVAERYRETVAA